MGCCRSTWGESMPVLMLNAKIVRWLGIFDMPSFASIANTNITRNKYEMDADHHNLNPCKTVLIVDKMVGIVTCMELVGLC